MTTNTLPPPLTTKQAREAQRMHAQDGQGKYRVRLNRPMTLGLPKPSLDDVPIFQAHPGDVFIVDSYHLACFPDELEILEVIESGSIPGKRVAEVSENNQIRKVLVDDQTTAVSRISDLGPGPDRMEILVQGQVIHRPSAEVVAGYKTQLTLVPLGEGNDFDNLTEPMSVDLPADQIIEKAPEPGPEPEPIAKRAAMVPPIITNKTISLTPGQKNTKPAPPTKKTLPSPKSKVLLRRPNASCARHVDGVLWVINDGEVQLGQSMSPIGAWMDAMKNLDAPKPSEEMDTLIAKAFVGESPVAEEVTSNDSAASYTVNESPIDFISDDNQASDPSSLVSDFQILGCDNNIDHHAIPPVGLEPVVGPDSDGPSFQAVICNAPPVDPEQVDEPVGDDLAGLTAHTVTNEPPLVPEGHEDSEN